MVDNTRLADANAHLRNFRGTFYEDFSLLAWYYR